MLIFFFPEKKPMKWKQNIIISEGNDHHHLQLGKIKAISGNKAFLHYRKDPFAKPQRICDCKVCLVS
jgi:hypothetical protein